MSGQIEDAVTLEQGLDIVHKDYVLRVINYLETKQM
jgi:hypothetical protein